MKRLHVLPVTAVLALLFLGVAQGFSPAKPRQETRVEPLVPFRVGEVLKFGISKSVLPAGSAVLTVDSKAPQNGSAFYHITATGTPSALIRLFYPVYYRAETWLDSHTLMPGHSIIFSRERSRETTRNTFLDQRSGTCRYEVLAPSQTQTRTTKELEIPRGTQDPLSALYKLRTLELRPGYEYSMPVSYYGALYFARVTVGPREKVEDRMAWRVVPVVTDTQGGPTNIKKMTIWIADDARRLPVRMEVELRSGSYKFSLDEVR